MEFFGRNISSLLATLEIRPTNQNCSSPLKEFRSMNGRGKDGRSSQMLLVANLPVPGLALLLLFYR